MRLLFPYCYSRTGSEKSQNVNVSIVCHVITDLFKNFIVQLIYRRILHM